MKDIRLIIAGLSIALSLIGYIILVITGHASDADQLLMTIGLPSLTFIIGLGSSIVGNKD